jgi:hypothetical protein
VQDLACGHHTHAELPSDRGVALATDRADDRRALLFRKRGHCSQRGTDLSPPLDLSRTAAVLP